MKAIKRLPPNQNQEETMKEADEVRTRVQSLRSRLVLNWVTSEELCRAMEITRRTMYRRIDEGILTPHSFGGRTYFRVSEIMEVLEQSATTNS